MTQLQEPRCFTRNCVHFVGVKNRIEGDDLSHVNFCNAFPDGIPDDIAYGDNLHTEPLKNQGNEIVFKKAEEGKVMTLDTEQMQRIIVDDVLKRKPTITGKKADEFRKDIQSDIKLARKNNWVIDIPPEWEV